MYKAPVICIFFFKRKNYILILTRRSRNRSILFVQILIFFTFALNQDPCLRSSELDPRHLYFLDIFSTVTKSVFILLYVHEVLSIFHRILTIWIYWTSRTKGKMLVLYFLLKFTEKFLIIITSAALILIIFYYEFENL